MCGIAGLWDIAGRLGADRVRERVVQMAAALTHRGPDDDGFWLSPDQSLGMGFRRLSIIDPSPTGSQPMESRDGRHVLVFNGELYNYVEIRTELRRAGHTFKGESDTEVVLQAIEHWGLDTAVEKFDGMFALAIFDQERDKLALVRDGVGIKPLYWFRDSDTVMFASELGAFLRIPEFSREIDRGAMHEYFRLGYIAGSRSVFAKVRKLRAGEVLRFSRRVAPESTLSWTFDRLPMDTVLTPENNEDPATILRTVLDTSISRQLRSDVPVACLLSSGLDSATVAARAAAVHGQKINTFTLAVDNPAYDESADAQDIAAAIGSNHTECRLTETDALNAVPTLADVFDEPFGDSSQLPTLLISREVRKAAKVVLTGDGGDELLGGYTRHRDAPAIWASLRKYPELLRSAASTGAAAVPAAVWDQLLKLAPANVAKTGSHAINWWSSAATAHTFEQLYEILVTIGPDPGWLGGSEQPPHFDIANPELSDFETGLYLDSVRYLPDDILTKVDRTTMSVGLEGRVPLLSRDVIELCWSSEAIRHSRAERGKELFIEILKGTVPEHILRKPKKGFSIPVGNWLRGRLREWAEPLLNPALLEQTGFRQPQRPRERWQQFLSDERLEGNDIWLILMYVSWFKRINTLSS